MGLFLPHDNRKKIKLFQSMIEALGAVIKEYKLQELKFVSLHLLHCI